MLKTINVSELKYNDKVVLVKNRGDYRLHRGKKDKAKGQWMSSALTLILHHDLRLSFPIHQIEVQICEPDCVRYKKFYTETCIIYTEESSNL